MVRAENLNQERLPSNTHLFRADQPGGRPPVRSEISRALEAGRDWATKRDLPDVAGWADLAANPSATRAVIARRIDQGRFPLGACLFPLPKPGKHESRPITWLDPFDDLILRCIVGRSTAAIKHSVDRNVVCSYPLETTGAGWSVSNARDANQRRRARGLEELRKESCAALGTLDIERYYESISIERLAEELEGLGAPAGAVGVLSSSLQALSSLGGAAGLPIGFEGSGPLANVYLVEGDTILRSAGIPVVRYTDDTWAFITNDHSWTECVEAYAQVIAPRGLVLKQSKVGLHDKFWGFAEEVIVNGALDYATEGGNRRITDDEAVELLEHELAEESADWTVIRFALGALRSQRSPLGLAVLQDHPRLFDDEPVPVANYLSSLGSSSATRGRIDHDWLVDRAVETPSAGNFARKLHACRVASVTRLGKQHGRRLREHARDLDQPNAVPFQCWAATAWSESGDFKPNRAVDWARESGNLSVRRAACLGLARHRGHPKASSWFEVLRRAEPDLEPTLRYALHD